MLTEFNEGKTPKKLVKTAILSNNHYKYKNN